LFIVIARVRSSIRASVAVAVCPSGFIERSEVVALETNFGFLEVRRRLHDPKDLRLRLVTAGSLLEERDVAAPLLRVRQGLMRFAQAREDARALLFHVSDRGGHTVGMPRLGKREERGLHGLRRGVAVDAEHHEVVVVIDLRGSLDDVLPSRRELGGQRTARGYRRHTRGRCTRRRNRRAHRG
jgi:hypothetical protein